MSGDLERAPVTEVVVRSGRLRTLFPYAAAHGRPGGGWVLDDASSGRREIELSPTELLVRQDILDSPVITTDPPRRARVGDVALELGTSGAVVLGLDLSVSGALRRLVGRAAVSVDRAEVPLSEVHLASPRGHVAQLTAPEAMVHGLSADEMAEVLTRASVAHAREIVAGAESAVREGAVRLLHPVVRDRVTGRGAPPRRMRRHAGWRLHRPGTRDHRDDA